MGKLKNCFTSTFCKHHNCGNPCSALVVHPQGFWTQMMMKDTAEIRFLHRWKIFGRFCSTKPGSFLLALKEFASYLVMCCLRVRHWTWAVSFYQNKSQTSPLITSEISIWPFNNQFTSFVPPAHRITVQFALMTFMFWTTQDKVIVIGKCFP